MHINDTAIRQARDLMLMFVSQEFARVSIEYHDHFLFHYRSYIHYTACWQCVQCAWKPMPRTRLNFLIKYQIKCWLWRKQKNKQQTGPLSSERQFITSPKHDILSFYVFTTYNLHSLFLVLSVFIFA